MSELLSVHFSLMVQSSRWHGYPLAHKALLRWLSSSIRLFSSQCLSALFFKHLTRSRESFEVVMGCEVDISICEGDFLEYLCGGFFPSRATRTSRKGSLFSDSFFQSNWMDGSWLLRCCWNLSPRLHYSGATAWKYRQHNRSIHWRSVERSEHLIWNTPCIGWQQQERAESPLLYAPSTCSKNSSWHWK